MDKTLERQLIEEFPDFFIDMYGDPRLTCMAFGCDFSEGWFQLLKTTCRKIRKVLNKDETIPPFKFVQIKEKFGMMTLYFQGGNDKIGKIIHDAQSKSLKICERCGSKNKVTTEGQGWIVTLCEKCRTATERR